MRSNVKSWRVVLTVCVPTVVACCVSGCAGDDDDAADGDPMAGTTTTATATGTSTAPLTTSPPTTTSTGSSGTSQPTTSTSTSTSSGGADGSSDATGSDTGEPSLSDGCGAEPGTILAGSIDVGGESRPYVIALPSDYDSSTPYNLVFAWHGCGANGEETQAGHQTVAQWDQTAIAIYPSKPGQCWDERPDGADIEFFDALYAAADEQLCFDRGRVYSIGFSSGGFMSNVLGCHRPDVIRGIAPVAGGLSVAGCTTPVAAWIVHGVADEVVTVDQGIAARDAFLSANGCSATTQPVDVGGFGNATCERYDGCDDNPVVWCTHAGGHQFQAWDAIIKDFFGALAR